jgi:hypothetical protein
MATVSSATTIVPSRASPAFAPTATVTMPLPVALAAPLIVIHPVRLVADHAHACELAVTDTLVDPPLAGTTPAGRETVKRHGAASCVTSADASFTLNAA